MRGMIKGCDKRAGIKELCKKGLPAVGKSARNGEPGRGQDAPHGWGDCCGQLLRVLGALYLVAFLCKLEAFTPVVCQGCVSVPAVFVA